MSIGKSLAIEWHMTVFYKYINEKIYKYNLIQICENDENIKIRKVLDSPLLPYLKWKNNNALWIYCHPLHVW